MKKKIRKNKALGRRRAAFPTRFIVCGILILLQILLTFSLASALGETFIYSQVLSTIFSVAVLLYMLNKDEPAAHKLVWAVVLTVLPVFGAIIYCMFGNPQQTRKAKKRFSAVNKEAALYLKSDELTMKKLEETSEEGEHTESKLSNAFGKIGSAAVKFGKVVAAGTVVAGAAIVKIGKDAIASYADYEQLVGGVETLFKDSADVVMGYAQQAYKTAGLSANEYMETVTSFSASLLQSLGGDTAEAAKIADMAITDMADNANKMGTDMEMIQNAYSGFAKDNYTMLDNLNIMGALAA